MVCYIVRLYTIYVDEVKPLIRYDVNYDVTDL